MIFNEIFPQFFPYSFHIHYKALVVFIYTYFEFSAQILKKKICLCMEKCCMYLLTET